METSIAVAVLAALLAAAGVVGIVVPVLPGSLLVAGGLLAWALWGGSSWGWIALAVGVLLLVLGASAQYVLTGRTLKEKQIPQRSVVVGLVCGAVGLFVIPGLGLVIGFVAGLLLSEFARVRDLRTALSTSWTALKSVGVGMLVELGCALAAATVLAASIVSHVFF